MPAKTASPAPHERAIEIGLPHDDRAGVVALLAGALADEVVLAAKTRNYHWNVTGRAFMDLHKSFEAQYEAMNDAADLLAERVRALGGWPPATLAEFAALTRLHEEPGLRLSAEEMVLRLLADHEAVVRLLREAVERCAAAHDPATADLFTALMRDHEKTAWMLRATL